MDVFTYQYINNNSPSFESCTILKCSFSFDRPSKNFPFSKDQCFSLFKTTIVFPFYCLTRCVFQFFDWQYSKWKKYWLFVTIVSQILLNRVYKANHDTRILQHTSLVKQIWCLPFVLLGLCLTRSFCKMEKIVLFVLKRKTQIYSTDNKLRNFALKHNFVVMM